MKKIKKYLLYFVAFILFSLFQGCRWHGFFARMILVVILLSFNSYSYAVSQFTTGAMKLFLLTCAILAYAIYKLIFDYTKWGIEQESTRQNELDKGSE